VCYIVYNDLRRVAHIIAVFFSWLYEGTAVITIPRPLPSGLMSLAGSHTLYTEHGQSFSRGGSMGSVDRVRGIDNICKP
jgi:hypothetical protein